MIAEEPGSIQKSFERRFCVFQSFQVGQVPVRLDRVYESIRRPRAPCLEGLRGGQLIESVIDLDRVESRGVELEPLLRRRFFRIETAAPALIIPAGASNMAYILHNRACRTY